VKAHALEGHRQTMAGVVPRLYQLLSNAVEADDARVQAVLCGKPWLWVGDGFVPADQVML
ncbi:unnamed protein product, partial [Hapterophycus canaliculatus]